MAEPKVLTKELRSLEAFTDILLNFFTKGYSEGLVKAKKELAEFAQDPFGNPAKTLNAIDDFNTGTTEIFQRMNLICNLLENRIASFSSNFNLSYLAATDENPEINRKYQEIIESARDLKENTLNHLREIQRALNILRNIVADELQVTKNLKTVLSFKEHLSQSYHVIYLFQHREKPAHDNLVKILPFDRRAIGRIIKRIKVLSNQYLAIIENEKKALKKDFTLHPSVHQKVTLGVLMVASLGVSIATMHKRIIKTESGGLFGVLLREAEIHVDDLSHTGQKLLGTLTDKGQRAASNFDGSQLGATG